MENLELEKVVSQKINGIPMEEFMANAIVELEEKDLQLELAKLKNSYFQQMNNRHKNIIDAQREKLKEYVHQSQTNL